MAAGAAKTGAGAQQAGWHLGQSIRYIAGMTRIFLVRHGEPAKSPDVDHSKWPLSRYGRTQADYAAERLHDMGPLNIVSSPALRCQETARFAAERFNKPVKVEPRVGELVPPRGVGDIYAWLVQNFPLSAAVNWSQLDQALNKWRADNIQAVRELKEDTVIFTHFININAIMGAALRLDATIACRPDYGSITEFSVVNGDIRLVMDGKVEIKGPNE